MSDDVMPRAISRQWRWQLRKRAEGKSTICGSPAVTREHCLLHRALFNARNRKPPTPTVRATERGKR